MRPPCPDRADQMVRLFEVPITELRTQFKNIRPTGGLLNLAHYEWKSIYTTNYDNLVEQVYQKSSIPIQVYSSNFDFGVAKRSLSARLYKIHGTLEKDIAFGDNSRIIISGMDYTATLDYRDHLYNTLKSDLADSTLLIVGSSLSDVDIKEIINKAIILNAQALSSGRITLMMYERDENRALLYEARGLRVVFGGINDLFAELAKKSPGPLFDHQAASGPMEHHPSLAPTVIDVAHQAEFSKTDVSKIFNGWPANYADIDARLTFERSINSEVFKYIRSGSGFCVALLGASGVGKTTAIRQILMMLRAGDYICWEHNGDFTLNSTEWLLLARTLKKAQKTGALFIDEAHGHLREINDLIDALASESSNSLIIILADSRNSWRPRVKTPNFFKNGLEFNLSRLDEFEIDRLINLVESSSSLAKLVEGSFSGFSRYEKRRRLLERCEADMFVCMRNIFASESFDDIILREYAELSESLQEIYRLVSALETSGVRVHRQLVIRGNCSPPRSSGLDDVLAFESCT